HSQSPPVVDFQAVALLERLKHGRIRHSPATANQAKRNSPLRLPDLTPTNHQNVAEPIGRKSTLLAAPTRLSLKTKALARNQSSSGAGSPTSCTFTNMIRVRPAAS